MAVAKNEASRLQVVSQAFRYCEYGAGQGQTRTLRVGAMPLQLVVNLSARRGRSKTKRSRSRSRSATRRPTRRSSRRSG